MAGLIEEHIQRARQLLGAAEVEYRKAQQERGGAAVTALRNSCGKGWLASLEAAKAFFLKQGVPQDELPDTDRGRRYFVRRYMSREMRRAYAELWKTFHIDGYYEGIVEFEDMPEYFEELREFIDSVEAAPAQDRAAE
jgi:hypothetical protein